MFYRFYFLLTVLCGLLLPILSQGQGFTQCNQAIFLPCDTNIVANNFSSGNNLTIGNYRTCADGIDHDDFSGNDVIYKVEVASSTLRLYLEDLSDDLDMFVFQGCGNRSRCIARSVRNNIGDEQITIPGANGTYYVVLDGYNASQLTSYRLTVRCRQGGDTGGTGSDCDPNTCEPGAVKYISCNESKNGTTLGESNNFEAACNYKFCYSGSSSFKGNDAVYILDVPQTKDKVEITLNDSRNLGLFIFKNSCRATSCLGNSTNLSANTKKLTINNASGRYYLVVDGASPSIAKNFKISVSCTDPIDDGFDCRDAITAECNSTINGSTRYSENNLQVDTYRQCDLSLNASSTPYSGGDEVYKVYIRENQNVNIKLSQLYANLDLFVFRYCGDAFDGLLGCVGSSRNSGNHPESVALSGLAAGYYYVVVDGVKATDNSSFRLKIDCEDFCQPTIDNDCDDLKFDFVQGGNVLQYKFSVPSHLPSGTWVITNGSQTAYGNGREILVNFSSRGEFKVCYTYKDIYGCEFECCRVISIVDPNECSDIKVRESGTDLVLSLDANKFDVLEWLKDGVKVGSNSSLRIRKPAAGNCFVITAKIYDVREDAYRICNIKVCTDDTCRENNEDCENINFAYLGEGLTYGFTVEGLALEGIWTIEQGDGIFLTSTDESIEYAFPEAGTYQVCYQYTDSDGCTIKCCRTICINDPFACEELKVDTVSGTLVITHPTIANENVVGWSANAILSSQAEFLVVPIPSAGECNYVTLTYFDPFDGCYRLCSIKICNDDFGTLSWLTTIIEELNACCTGGDKQIQRGILGDQTVFIAPDCASADGLTTVYDLAGNVICQSGGIAGLVCEELETITHLETVWTCLSQDCATISNKSIRCSEEGKVLYSFNLENLTGVNNQTLFLNLVTTEEIGFNDCSTQKFIPVDAATSAVEVVLENCASGALTEPVTILVEAFFEDPITSTLCLIDASKVSVAECSDCVENIDEDAFCTLEFAPVCGCNKVTYPNACVAETSGITLWVEGACETNTNNDQADLELDIKAQSSRYSLFSTVTYDITLTNNGPADATNIVIDAPLPEGTVLTAPADPNYKSSSQTFELATLEAGTSKTLTLSVFVVAASQSLVNFVQIQAVDQADPDSTPGNNVDGIPVEDDEAEEILLPSGGLANVTSPSAEIQLENTPNPFTTETTIQFYLPSTMEGNLEVFDVNGKNVFAETATYSRGLNTVVFDRTTHMPAGVYFYRLQTETFSATRTMIVQ